MKALRKPKKKSCIDLAKIISNYDIYAVFTKASTLTVKASLLKLLRLNKLIV